MAVLRGTSTRPVGDDANWSSLVATAIGTTLFVVIPMVIAIKGPGHIHGSRAPFARLPWRLTPFVAIAFAPVVGAAAILLRRPWLARVGVAGAIVLAIASWVLLLR